MEETLVLRAASLSFPLTPITIPALLIGRIIILLKTSWLTKGAQSGVKVIQQGCFCLLRPEFAVHEVLNRTWNRFRPSILGLFLNILCCVCIFGTRILEILTRTGKHASAALA